MGYSTFLNKNIVWNDKEVHNFYFQASTNQINKRAVKGEGMLTKCTVNVGITFNIIREVFLTKTIKYFNNFETILIILNNVCPSFNNETCILSLKYLKYMWEYRFTF